MPTELVTIPAGHFLMGAGAGDRFATDTERPVHRVTFSRPFALGAFPVTTADFARFRPGHAPDDDPALPVVRVSWNDAAAYCRWLAVRGEGACRLPSEAEWEYACRAGTTSPFAFGDSVTTAQANFFYEEDGGRVGRGSRSPRHTYPPNAFGLEDLHGNVCEWTADAWQADYRGAPADGSPRTGAADRPRVIRGGSWDYLPRLLRSAWRDGLPADARRDNVGFRVAADLPDPTLKPKVP